MRIKQDINAFVSLKDEYGKVINEQILVVAKSGYGKGLVLEQFAERFHALGYIVLAVSDPKHEVEFGYQMFEPEERYHLNHLASIGKLPGKQKVKLYHPFTFSIPTNRLLPDMNIFTIPIKSLGRKEWGLISEVSGENETISVLLKASADISNEDGIYSFLHTAQDSIKGKSTERKRKADPKNFYLEATSGTFKELTRISNYLRPFKNNFFLSKQSSSLNLNWKEILNDQESYHVFVSNFIGKKDEKLTDFIVLYLLESILKHKEYLKRPVVIVIPEISILCPFKPEGHKRFLAESVKDTLKVLRSSGRGMSSLLDSQVWNDIDEDVKGSSTQTLLGEFGNAKDIENISKSFLYKREIREQLRKSDTKNSYLIKGYEDDGGYKFFFPKSMHGEPHYNFEEMYRKHYQSKLKSYKVLVDKMRENLKSEELKIKEKIKNKEKKEKELLDKKNLEKEKREKEKESTEKSSDTKEQKIVESTEKIMKICYDIFNDVNLDKKDKTYRSIGKKLNLNHKTVKKYIDKYSDKQEENLDKDFVESFIEDN